jgi:predicted nucleic acid-binding protein
VPLDVPAGTRCFIDANIFVYHLVDTPELSDACSDFLERVEERELTGVTSAVAEVIHKVMLVEAMTKHNLPHRGLAHRLQRHAQLLADLKQHAEVAKLVHALAVQVIPTTLALLEAATELAVIHEVLTNDAITLAVMRQEGLSDIVTNDENFGRVKGLTVWTPRPS